MKLSAKLFILLFVFPLTVIPQKLDPDTVKAQKFDMGKMWTFENPPIDYFQQEYGFTPIAGWLEFVRKSALRFGNGCSASFISEDGLIMTNHHCARGLIPRVEKDNEDFLRDGFFAGNISEERKVPGLFVDQLLVIEDVTEEIYAATAKDTSSRAILKSRREKIKEIEDRSVKKDSSLRYRVVALYNGGKYSLYGYKRFNDIRLVFAPDLRTAKFGGDYDNFTYPRYGFDCTFLRAYENNKPVKTTYYFKWSKSGAAEGEVVFVVGNPGSTERLNTIAQMEYDRDVLYPIMVSIYRDLYDIEERKLRETGTEDYEQIARLYSVGNTLKVYEGTLNGLNDEYLMARKKDFESNFRNAVEENSELKTRYGNIWDEIRQTRKAASEYAREIYAYSINPRYSSDYFLIAAKLVQAAGQDYSTAEMDSLLNDIYPDDLDHQYQRERLKIQADLIINNLGKDNPLVQKLFGGKSGYEAVDYLLSNSALSSKSSFMKFTDLAHGQILKSDDPIIYFIINTSERLEKLRDMTSEIEAKETVNNQILGEALYRIYGSSIPPDATGTLRIADGVLKSYAYNGTIAPVYTTFYGVLDRHYGFNKQFPYNLPSFWENLPDEFDLSTKLNFISTNDIIGGNSGSPVINKNAEIVGLAFDGNMESLPARYIYTTEANRTLSVHSEGMIEGIRDLYKASRVSSEILNGKME